MEYYRGLGLQGRELNLIIQLTEDKLINVPAVSNIPAAGCIPDSARCGADGTSTIPGFRSILVRAIQNAVSEVENRIKLALYPREKTNLAQNPQEVYENRVKFSSGALNSFLDANYFTYPNWSQLSSEQQAMYGNDQNLYTDGTVPWDLLSPEQQQDFAAHVLYVPDKVEDEEKIDARGRSYIKFYERNILKIRSISLQVFDGINMGIPYLHRTFDPTEYFLYPKEGAVVLYPAIAKLSAVSGGALTAFGGYGLKLPQYPQLIRVSYRFGMEKIPPALQEAVALLAAVRAFEMINISYTKGMMSYSVSGFNASFGNGQYTAVIERYRQQAEDLLAPYFMPVLTSW